MSPRSDRRFLPPPRGPGRWFVLPAFLLALLPIVAFWWWQGRPIPLPEAPQARVPCVSYAPYQRRQTPFDEGLVIPPEQIDRDLALLAPFTDCVRTYSTDQGLAELPRLAEARGLKVLLGAWIGRERAKNEAELTTAIALAQRYPQTVTAVIVGNEVLLRKEQPPAELAAMIGRVRDAVPMPVTYADVWEFWEQHPEIADVTDFITIHTLPYWEDHPQPIERSIAHVLAVWRAMTGKFPATRVFIGEAGWPSAGRMRQGALPSPVNQARFVRELMIAAEREGIGLNLIEAFDQPWKRRNEGTVGGHWGLFDADRAPKVPLTGPVSDDPSWPEHAAAAALLGLLLLAPALVRSASRQPAGRWLALTLAAATAGTLLMLGIHDGLLSSRTVYDWLVFATRIGLAAAAAALCLTAFAGQAGEPAGLPASIAALRRRLRPSPPAPAAGPANGCATALGLVRALTLFGAAATALCLLFDARYRDFAAALYAVPALAFCALALANRHRSPPPTVAADAAPYGEASDLAEERLLAGVLVAAAVSGAVLEGFANHQALAWAAVCLLLAGSVLLESRARRYLRTSASAPRRAPPAAGSGT